MLFFVANLMLMTKCLTIQFQYLHIRRHSYYFLCCMFLCGYFSSGYYFFRKPTDINNGWIRNVQAIQWRLLDDVSSKQTQSVLLSVVEMSRTTQTALALAQWLSSEIVHIRMLDYSSCGYYSSVAFISLRVPDCVATCTIRGRCLFKRIPH